MTVSILCFVVAAIIFAVEAVRSRSWLAAGLCLFALGHCLVGAPAFGKP